MNEAAITLFSDECKKDSRTTTFENLDDFNKQDNSSYI